MHRENAELSTLGQFNIAQPGALLPSREGASAGRSRARAEQSGGLGPALAFLLRPA